MEVSVGREDGLLRLVRLTCTSEKSPHEQGTRAYPLEQRHLYLRLPLPHLCGETDL
jgi:hypothetical protein